MEDEDLLSLLYTQTISGVVASIAAKQEWTALFKICLPPGEHLCSFNYTFGRQYQQMLGAERNLSDQGAMWLLLYAEEAWQDAYFYIGDCPSRPQLADHATLSRERGGFRAFSDMRTALVASDDALGGSGAGWVEYGEQFIFAAKDHSTMYFALRSCEAGLPLPMRVQVSVTALDGASAPPAVCLSSMMQEVKIPANSGKKSSVCSSDVGAMCSLQGRTVFPLVSSSSSFRGNKVVALVSVVFAAVALGYHLFWRWKYKNS